MAKKHSWLLKKAHPLLRSQVWADLRCCTYLLGCHPFLLQRGTINYLWRDCALGNRLVSKAVCKRSSHNSPNPLGRHHFTPAGSPNLHWPWPHSVFCGPITRVSTIGNQPSCLIAVVPDCRPRVFLLPSRGPRNLSWVEQNCAIVLFIQLNWLNTIF